MPRPIYLYSVKYRRYSIPSRIHRLTVWAYDADDARRIVAIRDPEFDSTVASPKRGREVIPEPPDPMDQAKREAFLAGAEAQHEAEAALREFVEWRGCTVEVV